MTPSEELVANLSQRSFLSLWSFPNPQGKNSSKELCDLLVVCAPHVIIFSVKEIKPYEGTDYEVGHQRWQRKAIDESIKQIFGAEKQIRKSTRILTKDGQHSIEIPDQSAIKIHRIAVAIGGEGKYGLKFGDEGKGFVHTFDKIALEIVLTELDTITDFIDYVEKKEKYFSQRNIHLFEGEEDLLGFYIAHQREFPEEYDGLLLEPDIWENFKGSPEYAYREEKNKLSYFWDGIIEGISRDALNENLLNQPEITDIEKALRVLTLENRFNRRILSETFLEFLGYKAERKSKARIVESPRGVVYVFYAESGNRRQDRVVELSLRSLVARKNIGSHKIVIGIATEPYLPSVKGRSYDIIYLDIPKIDSEWKKEIEKMQEELGYFKSPAYSNVRKDEFPS